MKKMFICVSVIGVTAGVVYVLCKKRKSSIGIFENVDAKMDAKSIIQKDETFSEDTIVNEIHKSKDESLQTINERHCDASSIMKDAYSSIMENFVEVFPEESDLNTNNENKDVVIDSESVAVIKEIDSISAKLDKLLN